MFISDEEYFLDVDNFDPERFNEENKAERSDLNHLQFGGGHKNCIGLRFGLMPVGGHGKNRIYNRML